MTGTEKCSSLPDTLPESKPLLRVENVSMELNSKLILENIDLTVYQGDFFAISGPNGGGKTTLMRIILGLLKPSAGRVEFFKPGLLIGYLPQKSRVDSHFPVSVRETVASGLLALDGISAAERKERVSEMLRLVELTDHASKAFGALSGGQQQRALLARAIISRPQLLVLDEPLSYVDKHFEQRIYDIIASLADSTTILLVSHEMSAIHRMASHRVTVDRTLHVEQG